MTEETQNQAEPSLSESLVRRAIAITNRAFGESGMAFRAPQVVAAVLEIEYAEHKVDPGFDGLPTPVPSHWEDEDGFNYAVMAQQDGNITITRSKPGEKGYDILCEHIVDMPTAGILLDALRGQGSAE